MKKTNVLTSLFVLSSTLAFAAEEPPKPPLGFFVTSIGLGKGADLGGIAGARATSLNYLSQNFG